MDFTFDVSPVLDMALVASSDLTGARYVPRAHAPRDERELPLHYLRQLHTIANTAVCGVIAQPRGTLIASQWSKLGALRGG